MKRIMCQFCGAILKIKGNGKIVQCPNCGGYNTLNDEEIKQ